MFLMKCMCFIGAALLALAAGAGETAKKGDKKATTNAPPEFAVVCSNAWVKGVTEKSPVGYKVDEDIKFTVSFLGITNAIPAGKYFYKWKRTGDDGAVEEGLEPLTKAPFSYTTKLAQPGFVRFSAKVVTADGRPFQKKVGKVQRPLFFDGGAGVALDELPARPEAKPRDFDTWLRELHRKVTAVPFKNVVRTPVATPTLKGFQVFAVSVPCLGERPVKGYLIVPEAATKGDKLPCRVLFNGCGLAKEQPLPQKGDASVAYVTLVMAYEGAKDARAVEGFYPDLCAHLIRAFQYLKTQPEWDGQHLAAYGRGESTLPAILAGACGEGVTQIVCHNVFVPEHEKFDPLFFAHRIPPTCLVDIARVGLGDDQFVPRGAALLWNALAGEKKLKWVQGAQAWSEQRGFKDRDVLWEKLRPVTYRDMTLEHAKPTGKTNIGFADPDLALRDKIVLEVIVDPADLKEVNGPKLAEMKTYADKDKVPFTLYVSIPEKKVKDKVWADFVRIMAGANGGLPYPVYLNAGMDLPKPAKLPWYNVVDMEGVLRYSGPNFDQVNVARTVAVRKIPKPDPVFSYAPVKLFKAELGKPSKVKRTGLKLYKYIEGEQRKCVRTNPARAAEAEHLLIGMRQACDQRLKDIVLEWKDRPGRAWIWLNAFLADWPNMVEDARVLKLQGMVKKNPEIEKIAKLEGELIHLRDWKPLKSADIKKRDAAVALFRRKVEKYTKGKSIALQGEAQLIQAEFDNLPPDSASDVP